MIFAGDLALAMPTKDIYDTGMMQLVINAAKEQAEAYDKREQLYHKEMGDFYSPFAEDTKYWHDLTIGRVTNVANWLSQHNIPLDSAEARSVISRTMANTPTDTLAQLKQSAQTAKEYLKNYAVLAASGKLDPDAELWFILHELGKGADFAHWSTVKNGIWTRTTPYAKRDIKDLADQYVKDVDAMYDPEYSKNHDNGMNDYYTISPDRILGPLQKNLDAIKATPYGQYQYDRILQRNNGDTAAADKEFVDLLGAASGKLGPNNTTGIYKMGMNENAKMDKLFQQEEQHAANNAARELSKEEALLDYKASHGYGSGGGSGSSSKKSRDIFDDLDSTQTGRVVAGDPNANNRIYIVGAQKETNTRASVPTGLKDEKGHDIKKNETLTARPNIYANHAGTEFITAADAARILSKGGKVTPYTTTNTKKYGFIELTGRSFRTVSNNVSRYWFEDKQSGRWYLGNRESGIHKRN